MSRKNVFKKGFTLIELLVVIAIIGILSSIVLAQLGTARQSGQAGAVKAQLSSMRAQAEIYFNANPNSSTGYGPAAANCAVASSLFTSAAGVGGLSGLLGGEVTGEDCAATTGAWAVSATLPGAVAPAAVAFCVDSTGVARSTTAGGANYTAVASAAATAARAAGATACN